MVGCARMAPEKALLKPAALAVTLDRGRGRGAEQHIDVGHAVGIRVAGHARGGGGRRAGRFTRHAAQRDGTARRNREGHRCAGRRHAILIHHLDRDIAGILAHRAVRAAEQRDKIRRGAGAYQEQIRDAQRYAGALQRDRAGVGPGLGDAAAQGDVEGARGARGHRDRGLIGGDGGAAGGRSGCHRDGQGYRGGAAVGDLDLLGDGQRGAGFQNAEVERSGGGRIRRRRDIEHLKRDVGVRRQAGIETAGAQPLHIHGGTEIVGSDVLRGGIDQRGFDLGHRVLRVGLFDQGRGAGHEGRRETGAVGGGVAVVAIEETQGVVLLRGHIKARVGVQVNRSGPASDKCPARRWPRFPA